MLSSPEASLCPSPRPGSSRDADPDDGPCLGLVLLSSRRRLRRLLLCPAGVTQLGLLMVGSSCNSMSEVVAISRPRRFVLARPIPMHIILNLVWEYKEGSFLVEINLITHLTSNIMLWPCLEDPQYRSVSWINPSESEVYFGCYSDYQTPTESCTESFRFVS
jgi:hypothetical protein